ncbi:hypothetical protein DFH06DRAFT_1344718 [Mycena polygramma]|nr:hypothetical protein DFH06DRAFT_1344718 [Mycena polygramma]
MKQEHDAAATNKGTGACTHAIVLPFPRCPSSSPPRGARRALLTQLRLSPSSRPAPPLRSTQTQVATIHASLPSLRRSPAAHRIYGKIPPPPRAAACPTFTVLLAQPKMAPLHIRGRRNFARRYAQALDGQSFHSRGHTSHASVGCHRSSSSLPPRPARRRMIKSDAQLAFTPPAVRTPHHHTGYSLSRSVLRRRRACAPADTQSDPRRGGSRTLRARASRTEQARANRPPSPLPPAAILRAFDSSPSACAPGERASVKRKWKPPRDKFGATHTASEGSVRTPDPRLVSVARTPGECARAGSGRR